MEKDFHKVQAGILKELLFNNGAKFSQLNNTQLTNDHFTFHIKKLVEEGYIEKLNNKYYLTVTGKETAGKMDTENLKMVNQGKIGVIVAAVRNNNKEFLIQRRTKEPMYGNFGFPTGKVKKFDTTKSTAIRELKEETGLYGGYWTFIGVAHRLRGPSKTKLLADNLFFTWRVDDPRGRLINTSEGENYWKTKEEIAKLSPTFVGFEDTFKNVVKGKEQPFYEKYYRMDSM